jgi:hypothetical protein
MTKLMAGIAVAAAVTVAGCGGSGRLSKADFQAKADGICSKYNAKIKGALANVGSNPSTIASGVDKAVALIKNGTNELGKLKPPKQYDAKYGEWMKINRDEIATGTQLADAARKTDKKAFNSAIAKLASQGKDSDRLAREMGLKSCAEG